MGVRKEKEKENARERKINSEQKITTWRKGNRMRMRRREKILEEKDTRRRKIIGGRETDTEKEGKRDRERWRKRKERGE